MSLYACACLMSIDDVVSSMDASGGISGRSHPTENSETLCKLELRSAKSAFVVLVLYHFLTRRIRSLFLFRHGFASFSLAPMGSRSEHRSV